MWNLDDDHVQKVWPEAADIDPVVYLQVMMTANSLCVAYAPALPEGGYPSESYKLAEIITARDIWSKMGGGNAEQFGPDGLAIPVAPLVWLARDLLRPKTSPLSRLR
jgi:hypothetical protein